MAHKSPAPVNNDPSWAATDISYRWLYLSMVSIIVTVVVFGAILWPTIKVFAAHSAEKNRSGDEIPIANQPSGPLLQPRPESDMRAYRAMQQEILDSYGWQDRQSGIARLPVERAKLLILEEGVGPLAPGGIR